MISGLTISNPGGFIEGVSVENLLEAEPHGKNPVLSDALKRIGLAERTGRGIDRIYEGSIVSGKQLPDYSRSNSVSVRLFILSSQSDKAFVRMISKAQLQVGVSLSILSLLVLYTLKEKSAMTEVAIVSSINSSEAKVRVALEQLIKIGLVEATVKKKATIYSLSKEPTSRIR